MASLHTALAGSVALVTGASRGLGKGIALGLAEAGALVYATARTIRSSGDVATPGSLEDTAAAIERLGGTCVPVGVDHQDDSQVAALFERIRLEQNGRLDVLVNNAFAGVMALQQAAGTGFWQSGPELWDACHGVGLRSHYVASVMAARLMVEQRRGLICSISSWGGLFSLFGPAYGSGKAGVDRLMAECARDLRPHGIAAVSIWPGIVGTERIERFLQEPDGRTEADRNPSAVGGSGVWSGDRFNWETPLLTGRAIAALAADPRVMRASGKVRVVAELARRHGLTQEEGEPRPASLRSLRFLLPYRWPSLRPHARRVPDLLLPWPLLLLGALPSPRL